MPRKAKPVPGAETPAPAVEIPAVDTSLELRVSLANAIAERDALRCDVTGLRLENEELSGQLAEKAQTLATLESILDDQRNERERLLDSLAVRTEDAETAKGEGVVVGAVMALAFAVLGAVLYFLI